MKTSFDTAADLQDMCTSISAGTRIIVRDGGRGYTGPGVVLTHEIADGKSTLTIDVSQCSRTFGASDPERVPMIATPFLESEARRIEGDEAARSEDA